MCICDPWIRNFGAILSNSFVNDPSIEAGDVVPALLAREDVDVEYRRCLQCRFGGRQSWIRRGTAHRMVVLTIIASVSISELQIM